MGQRHRHVSVAPIRVQIAGLTLLWLIGMSGVQAQSINLDIGDPGNAPASDYAAAGQAGVWNAVPAAHGTTTPNLLDTDGQVTGVSLVQIGGLDNVAVNDPATSGADALLMDDYLVTFNSDLETCIFLDNMQPGTYEVIIYARMPIDSEVLSDTFVDQEPGIPHYSIGGVWPGQHQLGISYSRHIAIVGPDGNLDFHSGIVPGEDPMMGAAMNGFQVRFVGLFKDGFEE